MFHTNEDLASPFPPLPLSPSPHVFLAAAASAGSAGTRFVPAVEKPCRPAWSAVVVLPLLFDAPGLPSLLVSAACAAPTQMSSPSARAVGEWRRTLLLPRDARIITEQQSLGGGSFVSILFFFTDTRGSGAVSL